jgi:steroid 5-alpha reductase family enzyme
MLETLLFVLALNAVGFLIAFKFKTDKLTDISYALSFAGIAVYSAITNEISAAQWMVFSLVILWAVRLGSFLLYRVHVVGRDQRFDVMRNSFWLFGRFWLLQALTAWVVMLPSSYLFLSGRETTFHEITLAGFLIAIFGILFEGTADLQKFRFTQNKKNKGKWIDVGLWKYSRHPNYFGEITVWYGVYVACLPWLTDRQSFISIISPLTIVILLIGVSGIPILEKSADKRWGNDKKYLEYRRRTSVLLPLPLKK